MLLTMSFLLLIFVGIFLYEKNNSESGVLLFAIGIATSLTAIILILTVQIPKQAEYDKAVMERESLVYRLEHNSDSVQGNELLYSDILKYNKMIYSAKKWSANVWVNWFNNDKIAELDYIDIYESEPTE